MTISSNDSIIDSREVIAAADEFESDIEDKEQELTDVTAELEEAHDGSEDDDELVAELEDKILTLKDELEELKEEAESIFKFRDDVECYHRGGESLINEDYWATYVQELAEDVNGVDTSAWPFNRIDWEQAGEDLKIDYAELEWEGETFFIRA